MKQGQAHPGRVLAFAAAVVAAALVLATAAGAGALALQLTIAKHKSGPYVEMSPEATVKDRTRTFYFRAKNVSDMLRRVRVDDTSAHERPGDFKVRWFKGRKDITSKVRSGEYHFKLEPGQRRALHATVDPQVGHPRALCLALNHFVKPNGDAVDQQVAAIYVNSSSICG